MFLLQSLKDAHKQGIADCCCIMTMLLRTGQLPPKTLNGERIQQLDHPPYSPALAPCDFFVFPFVKSKFRGMRFNTPDLAVKAFLEHIEAIPQLEWASMFQKWFHCMQNCIDTAGEYFEKM